MSSKTYTAKQMREAKWYLEHEINNEAEARNAKVKEESEVKNEY